MEVVQGSLPLRKEGGNDALMCAPLSCDILEAPKSPRGRPPLEKRLMLGFCPAKEEHVFKLCRSQRDNSRDMYDSADDMFPSFSFSFSGRRSAFLDSGRAILGRIRRKQSRFDGQFSLSD